MCRIPMMFFLKNNANNEQRRWIKKPQKSNLAEN